MLSADGKNIACAECGIKFTPRRKNQRYHNTACRWRAWNRRHPRQVMRDPFIDAGKTLKKEVSTKDKSIWDVVKGR